MEIRRVGDSLLRSQRMSCAALTPSIPSRCSSVAQMALSSQHRRRQFQMLFSSSACSAISNPVAGPTSASTSEQDTNSEMPEKTSKPLDWLVGMNPRRTSVFTSPGVRLDNSAFSTTPTETERLLNKGNSATDLLSRLNVAKAVRPSNQLNNNPMADSISRLATKYEYSAPNGEHTRPGFEYADFMKEISQNISNTPLAAKAPMRLTPSTGKTVFVTQNVDVGRCFKLMEQLVGRNRVRATSNYQRFHERPGLKRKRLKSLRWRRKFMAGFKAAVSRVKQLKKQGW